ncbi:MAG TPA: cation diffusion facilitator family transporter [Vicinamibacterales bacterium]|nr:cation diffusion facilitator family transporter [Vicinamibacterales bacterium]
MTDRAAEVTTVLYRVFFLNLLVAGAKIVLGLSTGAVSVLSDGFHSLTDTASNVVAIIGVRIASAPPDVDHPYGHRKFETLASLGILVFLLLVLREVLSGAWERLRSGGEPSITAWTFIVMGGTFVVNLAVVRYERRAGNRLKSEVLLADAHHTMSDLLTSATVIAALIGVQRGVAWLDPAAAVVVAAFIGYACWEIFQSTTGILGDRIVIPEEEIRAVIQSVPEVIGSHHIRTRGSADFVFLDLHIWMRADMSLDDAHGISHVVKDRLMERFPQIKDAIIHIEPPPRE